MKNLVIKNPDSKKEYLFDLLINQVEDSRLIRILKHENYKNEDCGFFLSSENDLPISEVIQIKINIKQVGTVFANFRKEELLDDNRKILIEDVSKLKSDDYSDNSLKNKVKELLILLNKYNPIYISFSNSENTIINKEDLEVLLQGSEFDTPLLCLTKPRYIRLKEIGAPQEEEEEYYDEIIIGGDSKDDGHVRHATRKEKSKKTRRVIQLISFKDYLADYIFVGIFCFIIAFSLLEGLIMAFNQDTLSIFLFVCSGLFVGIYAFANYKYLDDFKEHSYSFQKIKFPIVMSIVGVALGIGIGFVTGYFVIKPGEGITIDYVKALLIAIFGSLGGVIVGCVACSVILYIKLNSKKAQ